MRVCVCVCALLCLCPALLPLAPRCLCIGRRGLYVVVRALVSCICLHVQHKPWATIVVKGILASLDAPDWMLAQTQEKGSYRTSDVVAFLDWALPTAACPQDSIVVLLDWYSAHLSAEVAELVASKGHILLFHGGGVTGMEQVNVPRPYS